MDVHANVSDALNNIVKLQKANEELKQSIASDKKSLQELQKQMEEAGGATAEQAAEEDRLRKSIVENSRQVAANTAAINGNTKAVDLSIATAEQKTDSLLALRKEAAALTQRYQEMSAEEREAAKENGFVEHLKSVNDTIREATLDIGNFKDNIGNYKSAIADTIQDSTGFGKALRVIGVNLNEVGGGLDGLKSGFAAAGTGVKGLGKAFTTLAANPIVAIIGVIAGLILSMKKAIQDNSAAAEAWNKVLAGLEPIIKGLGTVVSWVGEMVVKMVSTVMAGLTKIARGVAEIIDWFSGLVGAEKTAVKALEEYTAKADDMAKTRNAITAKELELTEKLARYSKEVSELRVKAEDKVNYSIKERLKYLDEAIAMEQEAADERANLAKMKLELAEKELAMDEKSISKQQAVAEARAASYEAEKERNEKYRELQAQRIGFLDEEKARLQAIRDAAKTATEEAKALGEAMRTAAKETEAATEQMQEDATDLAQNTRLKQIDAEIAAVKKQFEEQTKLRKASAEEVATYNAEVERLNEQKISVLEEQEEERYRRAVEAAYESAADGEAVLDYVEQLEAEHQENLLEIKRAGLEQEAADRQQYAEAEQARQLAQYSQLEAYYRAYEDAKKAYGEQSEQSRVALLELEKQAAQAVFSELGAALLEYNGVNKAAFEAGKAVSIATTTVQTFEAAQKSYSAMAGIPFVGPALGAAAAAAAVASGLIKVKKIKETKWSGGGSSSDASASSASSSASTATSSASSSASTATSSTTQARSGAYYDYSSIDSAAAGVTAGRVAGGRATSETMTRADMVAAIKAIPAPVVSVQDINNGQETVRVRQEATTL